MSNANSAIGSGALTSLTTGASNNTALGYEALKGTINGQGNTAIGSIALKANTNGGYNTASGYFALGANTTGSYNSASGYYALGGNISGSYNTGIGYLANVGSGALTNATAIGYGARVNASNTIQLGDTKVTSVNTSGTVTATGFRTPTGTASQFLKADGTADSSIILTTSTTAVGASALAVNTGFNNTAVGAGALAINATGSLNTAIGLNALKLNNSGYQNTAIGMLALSGNVAGNRNTAIGQEANVGSNNLTNATVIGAGAIVNASNTIQLGDPFITSVNTSGTVTAAGFKVGTSSGFLKADGTVDSSIVVTFSNTAIGTNALSTNTSGSSNTAIGKSANVASGTLMNATAIGADATVSTSNTIQLGSTSVTAVNTSGIVTAAGFKVGTSSGFLKADGKVDSSIVNGSITALGSGALAANTSGTLNTAIGRNADVGSGGLMNATAIGAGAVVNDSNTIQLGNTNVTAVNTSGTVTAAGFKTLNGSILGITHYVGEPYGGGIVFYTYDDGQHGLIAANGPVQTAQWSSDFILTKATKDGVRAGIINTMILNIYNANAAVLCSNYKGGDFGDWYLPSLSELKLLYPKKNELGIFTSNYVWSSTEVTSTDAKYMDILNGFEFSEPKTKSNAVIPIRAF